MVAFSPDVFADFLAEEDDAPVVMLNLLRFVPDGGRERHLEYLRMAEPDPCALRREDLSAVTV